MITLTASMVDLCLLIEFINTIPYSVVACMHAILYSAEQFLSHGHADLIHHLSNARTLLDGYLSASQLKVYSLSYTQKYYNF